jgi:hypothetical protein
MYLPLDSKDAQPLAIPLDALRILLRGGDCFHPIFVQWQQWLDGVERKLLPSNLFSQDTHVAPYPAKVREGTQGWVWVSENFADQIKQVYLESLTCSAPTLPFTPFWTSATPYWNTPDFMVRASLESTVYHPNDVPLSELARLSPNVSTVIVTFATPTVFNAGDATIDYVNAIAEANTLAIVAAAHANGQKVWLSVGSWGRNQDQSFVDLCASDQLMQVFSDTCVAECTRLGLVGIELSWEWPNTPDKQQKFTRLVEILSATLHAAGFKLASAAAGADPTNSHSAYVITLLDRVNPRLYDLSATHSSYDEVAAVLNDVWLPKMDDPHKLHLSIPCYGWDLTDPMAPMIVSYRDLVGRYGESVCQQDSLGAIVYNGVPTAIRKAELAVALGLGGVSFWDNPWDVSPVDQPDLSLIESGSEVAWKGTPVSGGVRCLLHLKGWTFVTGPSNWKDTKRVAVMVYPADTPYSKGRAFVDSTLSLLN